MKNDYIVVICLLLVTIKCIEVGNADFFDSYFDNLKVSMKKIQKKQSEIQEAQKEAPKQSQANKSQKELLEEQLQQIQKYTPSNITIEGGRVFTQHESDEDVYEEEEDVDEVLLAIKQIDTDAQFDGIEFIFKKRQIDMKRMFALLTMIDNGEIDISFRQIRMLAKKYQFEEMFQKSITYFDIQEEEQEEEEEEEVKQIFEETENFVQEDNFSFDDLIDFDNDEIQHFEENVGNSIEDENFIFDEPDLDNFEDIQYWEEMVDHLQIVGKSLKEEIEELYEEIEELYEEIVHQKEEIVHEKEEIVINEEEIDYFEELKELEYFEEEISEEQYNLPKQQIFTDSFVEQKLIDNIVSKEEQKKTYLEDESFREIEFNFQENTDSIKFQKEFDLIQKSPETNLTDLKAQFNLSEESLQSINQKYELMDQQFNPTQETTTKLIQPQFIQLSQEQENVKFLQIHNSSQLLDDHQTDQIQNYESNLLQFQDQNESQTEKTEMEISQNSPEETKTTEIIVEEKEIEQSVEDQNQNVEEISKQVQQSEEKSNNIEESTQLSKSNIKQITSKPAQPHELIMSTPSSEISEKSEEEIAKEKELKAKARYAKRYQALDVENEHNKKKEEDETHFVKVDQNIDDIFIIQSLASTKKNNVVEMKDLKEEPQSLSSESDTNIKIEIYNSNSEQHLQKNQKTQHFVEAFVQDMSLKSYTCDPKYFGPHKEARKFVCDCSDKIFQLDEESWYLAGSIQFYKQYEKIFEQIKKSIPQIYVGTSNQKVCFSSQYHQPIILNDFLKEMFLKTKIQNNFITIPNVLSLSYVQMEFSENKVKNFVMEVESNDEIKLNLGFNIKRIDMRLAQEDLHIQYIGSFLTHQQQIPFRLTNEYGKLKIDTMEVTVQLPQDEQICLQICSQILSGDVAKQLQAFLNFKKGQYFITVKVLSSNESFEIFYSIRN